jgi:hypothetical protein
MNTSELSNTLTTLFSELVDGAPQAGAYMLNRGDPGLLASLDRLRAAAASAAPPGESSIAAHVEHVRYGLSLMNRWAAGEENPFADANWGASWRRGAARARVPPCRRNTTCSPPRRTARPVTRS